MEGNGDDFSINLQPILPPINHQLLYLILLPKIGGKVNLSSIALSPLHECGVSCLINATAYRIHSNKYGCVSK